MFRNIKFSKHLKKKKKKKKKKNEVNMYCVIVKYVYSWQGLLAGSKSIEINK